MYPKVSELRPLRSEPPREPATAVARRQRELVEASLLRLPDSGTKKGERRA
ncbi:MAG: hypothetical protein V7607_5607 [Solirubrobacteraceae bacterium]